MDRSNLILTPRVHDYLLNVGELVLSEENAARLIELVTTHPRVRKGSFSPSSSGLCLRRQVMAYLGAPELAITDANLQNIFLDGTWRHLRWQFMGLEAGWFTDIEVSMPVEHWMSNGSIDAVNDDEDWLFELKGTSYATTKLRDEFPEKLRMFSDGWVPPESDQFSKTVFKHLLQIHRYFRQSGEVFGEPYSKAVLVYENKSTQDWIEFNLEPNEALLEIADRELMDLTMAVDRKELPEMLPSCRKLKGKTFKECKFHHVCPDARYRQFSERKVRIVRKKS